MLQNRYKLRSQAACQSELGSRMDIEHRNEGPAVKTNELGLSINNIRRSARLHKMERVTSSSQDKFIPERNNIDCKIETSKSRYSMEKSDISSMLGARYVPQVEDKNTNHDVLLAETGDASLKSSTSAPSLEFHVRSEEGIKLVVDLNSSPSDWSKSMENGVCQCQKFQKKKFQCFRQELEYLGNSNNLVRSSLINTSDCVTEGHIQNVPTQECIHKENDQPAGKNGSSRFPVRKTYGGATQVAVSSEKEKEVPFLSASGVSSIECCPRVGEIETQDSVGHDALQANGRSPINLRKKGSKNSRTMEEQSFKINLTLAISQVLGEEHNIQEMQNDISDIQSEKWSELVASGTHKRKRHHLESDFNFGLHAGRILRSTKHFKGLVLRRSKRLGS